MIVYRLCRQKYKSHLSGRGAAIRGGRWNKEGTEAIYTASSRALAMAEVLVHFALGDLPEDYFMLVIYIPDSIPVYSIDPDQLPRRWNRFPYTKETQHSGDALLQQKKYCVIKTPSAVVRGDHNYLINPAHKDFERIKIVEEERFPFDKRLVFSA